MEAVGLGPTSEPVTASCSMTFGKHLEELYLICPKDDDDEMLQHVLLQQLRDGGGGGSRTRVREYAVEGIYMRSRP